MEKVSFEQAQYLIANHKTMSYEQLSGALNLSVTEIIEFCIENNLETLTEPLNALERENLMRFVSEGVTDANLIALYLHRPVDLLKKEIEKIEGTQRTSNSPKQNKFRSGRREDLDNLFVRSSWEANYARYLNWLLEHDENVEFVRWEYEPDEFEFPVKRGNKFYIPDFKLFREDGSYWYVEVKGRWDNASLTKVKRFYKYFRSEKLQVIDKPAYQNIKKQVGHLIPNWE